jgi:hypothetical protein
LFIILIAALAFVCGACLVLAWVVHVRRRQMWRDAQSRGSGASGVDHANKLSNKNGIMMLSQPSLMASDAFGTGRRSDSSSSDSSNSGTTATTSPYLIAQNDGYHDARNYDILDDRASSVTSFSNLVCLKDNDMTTVSYPQNGIDEDEEGDEESMVDAFQEILDAQNPNVGNREDIETGAKTSKENDAGEEGACFGPETTAVNSGDGSNRLSLTGTNDGVPSEFYSLSTSCSIPADEDISVDFSHATTVMTGWSYPVGQSSVAVTATAPRGTTASLPV